MSMLTRITSISVLQDKLQSGIVCLTDTNEQGEICHAYLTTNIDLIGFFGFSEDELECESEEVTEEVTVAFNILEGDFIHLQPAIYTGYTHQVAQLTVPDDEQLESELLKLNLGNFVDDSGNTAELINVLDESQEFNLVFSLTDEDGQQVVQVNELGINEYNIGKVFNADGVVLVEREGYILISKKHEPVFVRKEEKDSIQLIGKSKLLSAIGYINSKEHLKSVVLLANSV